MPKPTKAELKQQRKSEWEIKAAKLERDAKVKKYGIWAGAAIGFLVFVGLLIWLVQSPSTPSSSITVAPVSSKDIQQGPASSKATLIEYADFQCPACKAYHPFVNQLLSDEKGRIRYIYRFFPLTNIHQNAQISAQAGYAAYLQGKFWEMNNMLFDNQDSWATLSDADARSTFVQYAQKLGLDVNKFKSDLDSDATKSFVAGEQAEGTGAGVNSTPTFILNGKQISNPPDYNSFKKLVDDALSSK